MYKENYLNIKKVVVERFSNYSERPDYTLTLNGVSKLFVEAKKPSVDIVVETEPAIQARNMVGMQIMLW